MKKATCFLISLLLILSLPLAFALETGGNVLKDFVGEWEGQSGNIHLTFTVNEDGSGQYTYEQSDYRESYPVRLSADDNTFAVDIPANNALSITTCEGAWLYEDEVLTLDVVTTFANGRQFSYSIPCRRVNKDGAAAAPDSLEAQLGKCSETDKQFIWPGNITWDSTRDDVVALLGEDVEQIEISEDVTGLSNMKYIQQEQSEMPILYAFRNDELICIIQAFSLESNSGKSYDELCAALSGMYGEANLTDFSRISSCLIMFGVSPEILSEQETAPWSAWMLPDQNTLVFAIDYQGVGVMYFNTARLQAQ